MRIKLGPYYVETRIGRYLGYTPAYNSACFRDKFAEPDYYNRYGEKLDPFFISDTYRAHDPYVPSRYMYFDRYNWGLKKHIYTCSNMLKPVGNPDIKYGALTESRTIIPQDYDKIASNPALCSEFKFIFTYDDRIMDRFSNAVFAPFSAYYWYGVSDPSNIRDDLYTYKTKNVSILASGKELCHMHTVRKKLAVRCRQNGLADTFGTFDGGAYIDSIDDTLKDYRFSIIIENDVSDYYFTEKVTNCFISQTVPIYLGARRIGDFFDQDGIIRISESDLDHIDELLESCTVEAYAEKIPAIMNNYERVKQFKNPWDFIYTNYISK